MEQIAKEEQRKAWKLQGIFVCSMAEKLLQLFKSFCCVSHCCYLFIYLFFVSTGIGEKYTTWEPTKRELELLRHNPKRRKITTNCTIGGQQSAIVGLHILISTVFHVLTVVCFPAVCTLQVCLGSLVHISAIPKVNCTEQSYRQCIVRGRTQCSLRDSCTPKHNTFVVVSHCTEVVFLLSRFLNNLWRSFISCSFECVSDCTPFSVFL